MHKMGIMQRFSVWIVAVVSFVMVLGSTNAFADQSGSGYSVSANIPAFQSNKNISYFDLQLQPKQKETVTIHLTNNGQEKAVYLVNVNNAATNSNGVIDYNQTDFEQDTSAKYVLKDLMTPVAQEVELAAGQSKDIPFQITMPAASFKGIVLGGIHVSKKDTEEQKVSGTAIRNKYAYVIGVKLYNSSDAVQPDLKLRSAKAGLQNYYTTIFANLQNPTPTIISKVTIDAKITKKGSATVLYETKKENLSIAPNTNFNFPVNLDKQKIAAGDYTVTIDAKEGKTNKTWHLTKDFTSRMIFQEKQPLTSANFLWVSIVFLVFSLSAFSTKAAAEGDYPETTEATIFDGHVKASIAYTKDHAPNYTAVGDTVTVTTTLEKLDAGVLPDKFKQSSVITLFPDETQGLTLKSEPTFTYQKGVLTDQGAFVDPSKKLYQGLIGVFNFSVNLLYHDTESYAGRMTEIPITNEYDDGPYDDSYSLYNLLVDRGDKIILSYKATVTQKALQNKEFYLHSVVYDSEAGDFDWNAFLTTKMPSIQTLGVSFDSQTKNKKLDVTGLSTIKTTLTGTWSGAIADFHTNLTINGTSVSIPAGSFKDDYTFSIPVDLTKIGKMGDNQVHIEATDSNQQIANDDATITLYTTNTAPQIQLSDSILNQIIPVTPSDKFFTITGQWKDDDSLVVGVYYKLNGGSERMIQNNLLNQSKGKWTDFSEQIPLSDLRQGDNSVEVYVKDVDGAQSEVQSFDLQLGSGSVRFTAIPATVQFQSLTLNGLSLHSSTVAPIGLQIEDTTGNPQAWKLTVNQTTPFANESYDLPALLSYQNGTSQVPITDQGAVTVPVTSENAKNFQLQQDADHQFDLQVAPNAYVGSYQSTLEWTIVEAP